jgi:hypothetical protein
MADEEHISTDRARGGEAPGHVRYILMVGLFLIIILFGALLLFWS